MKLSGKVAIVTGAGSGIGAAIGEQMAAEGAKVVIADLNLDGAKETVRRIEGAGHQAIARQTDVARAEDIDAMVDCAVDRYGRLDILVNNAGVAGTLFDDFEPESFRRVIDVNLTSAFLACKAAVAHMQAAGGGSIVNTASIAGQSAFGPMPDYNAAKAGVILLTRTLARQLGPRGIRVNAICPGPVRTGLTQAFRLNPATPEEDAEREAASLARVPLGWIAEPHHVAPAAVFLASDDAAFITGVELPVDGGLSA